MCQACGLLESSEEGASECYPVFRVVVKDEDGLNSTTGRIKKAPPRGANFLSFDTGEVAIAIPGLSKADTEFSLAVWILLSSEVNQSAPVLRLGEYKVRVEGVSGLRLIGFGDVIEIETVADTWTHLAVTYNPTSNSGAYYVNGTKSSIGAGVTGRRLLQAPATTEDFSCDATLLMRYAFDDAANPGIDSVSGNSAGLSGAIAVQNSYAVFNGGAVRLEPLTVLEGDDITFTWWMRPLSSSDSRNSFRIGRNGNEGRIQWYRATEWVPYMKTPSSGWVYESLDPGMIPFDSTTWSFVAWKIRASDGLWSITVNESEVFRGVKIAVHPKTYDDEWHHIGSIDTFSYWGAQDDFRIYRSFLSDAQVAAVRAGGPASACAAPVDFSCDAGLVMRYAFDDPANPWIDSVSGNSGGISGAVIVQDSYAVFNGGTVRLEPLTVLEGEDISFCFWLNAAVTTSSTNVFKIGFDANDGRMQLYYNHAALLWQPYVKLPGSGWIYVDIQSSDIPRNSDTWVFVSWSIRASDGLWSIWVDDTEIINSITSRVHPKTYNDDWHRIGEDNFYGSIDDFRIYRTRSSPSRKSRPCAPAGPRARALRRSPLRRSKIPCSCLLTLRTLPTPTRKLLEPLPRPAQR